MYRCQWMSAAHHVQYHSCLALPQGALSPVAELPMVCCSVVRYSHSGGLIAAVGRNNAICIYPAYYGQQSASTARYGAAQHHAAPGRGPAVSAAAAAGFGVDAVAALVPVVVLKGHVSAVTDVAFTSDDRRLISSGAGGAVYWWDLATGSRLVELDHVDKRNVYCAGEGQPAVPGPANVMYAIVEDLYVCSACARVVHISALLGFCLCKEGADIQ